MRAAAQTPVNQWFIPRIFGGNPPPKKKKKLAKLCALNLYFARDNLLMGNKHTGNYSSLSNQKGANTL